MAGAVVVGNHHGSQVPRCRAGGLEGLPVQAQDGHHGAVAALGGLLHGLPPEGHQADRRLRVKNTRGVKGGILPQGEARRRRGDDALLPQHRRQSGGKGHHAGLGITGLVQHALRVLEAGPLQVKVHLRLGGVQHLPEGRVRLVQIRPHAGVLAALSGV